MKIIAKRPFISSRVGIGNVPEGRVLDIDDNYAKSLIKAGLAGEYPAAPALKAVNRPSFISPVGANAGNGGSLPPAQASQRQTARNSRNGARRTRAAR